ncbi:MAG: FAD-dependent oxidoreductase [Campylobacterota bacterium]
MNSNKIAVIGSGISGLSAAYELQSRGYDVTVFEKEPSVGGRLSTSKLGEKDVSLGGKNIGKKYVEFRRMCRELHVDDFEKFGLNSTSSDSSLRIDKDRPLKSLLSILTNIPLSDIFKMLPMIRAIKRDRENAYLSGPYFRDLESKSTPLTDVFSEKSILGIIRPLVVRNNGAEAEELTLETFGTNLAMVLDSYEQFTNGPAKLFEKLSELVAIKLNTSVSALCVEDGAVKGVVMADGSKELFERVVVATTADAASHIVKSTNAELSDALDKVRYNPVGILVAEYPSDVFTTEQRAFIFPQENNLSNAGAYGMNDLNIVRYTFSGKVSRDFLASEPSSEELLKVAEQEFTDHTGITLPQPLKAKTGLLLRSGLSAYSSDHTQTLKEIMTGVSKTPGLYLAGDYLEGVSIEACYRSGLNAAEAISAGK